MYRSKAFMRWTVRVRAYVRSGSALATNETVPGTDLVTDLRVSGGDASHAVLHCGSEVAKKVSEMPVRVEEPVIAANEVLDVGGVSVLA